MLSAGFAFGPETRAVLASLIEASGFTEGSISEGETQPEEVLDKLPSQVVYYPHGATP
jgi:hypothetical protein